MLFSFQVFGDFPVIFVIDSIVVRQTHAVLISIIWYLLRFVS